MTIPPGVDNVPEGAALSQTMGIPGRKQSSIGTQGAGIGAVVSESIRSVSSVSMLLLPSDASERSKVI